MTPLKAMAYCSLFSFLVHIQVHEISIKESDVLCSKALLNLEILVCN